MAAYYDEIEIEDFTFDEDNDVYTYPCPCGDKFSITTVRNRGFVSRHLLTPFSPSNPLPLIFHQAELMAGEDTVRCPSCSLLLRVIYDLEDFAEVEVEAAPALPVAEVVN